MGTPGRGCLLTPLPVLEAPGPALLGDSAVEFLRRLDGPAAMLVPGRDRGRRRAVVTLLHGNEPSGVVALHRWLRSGAVPAVDALLILGAVEAALAPPGFAARMLPGRRDLNRCFVPPFSDEEGRLAERILALVQGSEALVDVHNNSGRNPAYGVVAAAAGPELGLVALFAPRCVVSHLRLGTLTEVTAGLPAVTIECGRGGDPAADEVAFAGLGRYLGAEHLAQATPGDMRIYEAPLRVCLRPGSRVVFADAPDGAAELTLLPDIDRHNFAVMAPGTPLGWLAPGAPWPLVVRDEDGAEVSALHFAAEGGVLRSRDALVPIMMTTSARIASDDCLCYLVRPR